MTRKVKATPPNIETLAAAAKAARQAACDKEVGDSITAICAKHNCQPILLVKIGEQVLPLAEIITLPVMFAVVAQDVLATKPGTQTGQKDS